MTDSKLVNDFKQYFLRKDTVDEYEHAVAVEVDMARHKGVDTASAIRIAAHQAYIEKFEAILSAEIAREESEKYVTAGTDEPDAKNMGA